MIYELRVYRAMPRHMPALIARFQNHTQRILDKHGIHQAGLWTTIVRNAGSLPKSGRYGRPNTAFGKLYGGIFPACCGDARNAVRPAAPSKSVPILPQNPVATPSAKARRTPETGV